MVNQKTKTTLIIFLFFYAFANAQKGNDHLKIWDNQPAADWITQAYPIGNGKLGAMIFGGVKEEHIQFNEISLWTGDEQETGAYQAFGNIFISFDDPAVSFSDYRRELDLNTSLHHISYKKRDVDFKRTYFSSHPDQVIALNYTANKKGNYTATIRLNDAHNARITAKGKRLQLEGQLSNGLKYASVLSIKYKGGKVNIINTKDEPRLRLEKVDEFTLLLSAATNYVNKRSQNWRGKDPLPVVNQHNLSANKKSIELGILDACVG